MRQIFQNKTVKYLFPCLIEYGEEFVKSLNYFTKVFVGIGDLKHIDFNIENPQIYILFEIEDYSFIPFFQFLKELKQKKYYVDDYPFKADIRDTKYFVVVLTIPEKHRDTYYNFKKGNYSQMYSEEDIDRLYAGKECLETRVLRKDTTLYVHLVNRIKEEYATTVSLEDMGNINEYELPPDMELEVLNSKKMLANVVDLIK